MVLVIAQAYILGASYLRFRFSGSGLRKQSLDASIACPCASNPQPKIKPSTHLNQTPKP